MIEASDFINGCKKHGFTFFSGVPCSFLKPLINYALQRDDLDYVAASSEGEAVGIASGAYLCRRGSVVMCQNSGLGNMANPLTSLNFPFRIPLLLIVTLRGAPEISDEPQHELMGAITSKMLDTMRIQWDYFPTETEAIDLVLNRAIKVMKLDRLPFALIMEKGSVKKTEIKKDFSGKRFDKGNRIEGDFNVSIERRITRIDAIEVIHKTISKDCVVVASTGKIGRELFSIKDTEKQFYVVGSMGCASGIGLGIQTAKPSQPVVVLDGDGAALMKMGTIATIGHYLPKHYLHIILDNETYDSTGGQFTISSTVDFCEVAAACGYRHCYRIDNKEMLREVISVSREIPGPILVHVKVSGGSVSGLGRPDLKPYEVKKRFIRYLKNTIN